MKRLLQAFAAALLALMGVSSVFAQTGVVLTPNVANPSAVTVGVSFTLMSDWEITSTSVTKSNSATGGPLWTLDAVATRSVVAIPPTPRQVNLNYALGAVARGTTGKLLWTYNGKLCSEATFTVPHDGISATAAIAIHQLASGVAAKVHVDFKEYAAITGQKAPFREGNRFILEATAERVAVIQIFPPPPLPSADLNYALGDVAAGEYVAVFKLNGTTLAEKQFTVSNAPPPVEATVTSRFSSTTTGTVAHVRIVLPDPYYEMSDPGTPVVSGNTIRINATLVPIMTLVALPSPKIIERDYALGVLVPGDYSLMYLLNGSLKLTQPFRVGEGSTAPKLVGVDVRFLPTPGVSGAGGDALVAGDGIHGIWQGVAHLLLMPDTVAEAGPLVQDGNAFKATIILHQLDRPISSSDRPMPVDVTWNLGSPAPGAYTFAATLPGSPPQTAETTFRVIAPPPPASVHLAYVEVRKSDDGTTQVAEVGVAITDPTQTITNWGTPRREGNKFVVALTVGPRPVFDPVLPPGLDGADGELANHPVLQGQALVALAGDVVPGAFPIRILRHRYDLGSLDPGFYQLEATVDGKSIGLREFRIHDTPPPPGPVVAGIEIGRTSAGSWNATVRVVLPQGQTVSDWGTVQKDGTRFKVSLTVESFPNPEGDETDAALVRPLLSHAYDLGFLTEGSYSFAVCQGDNQLAFRQFRVEAAPPPPPVRQPRLAFIDIKQGDASTAAEVGILLPQPGYSVSSWGDVTRDGAKLKATILIQKDEIVPAVILPPTLERHTYSLGALEAGEYKLTICYQTSNTTAPVVLGARAFVVHGPPPPPPGVPLPLVARLVDGTNNAGTFIDLYLAWPRPGWTVSDWGTPVLEGNRFKTTLTIGKAVPPVSPGVILNHDDGAEISLIPPGDEFTDRLLDPMKEIGGWPTRLVRHRYHLGILPAGDYAFAVCVGSKTLAVHAFTVPDPVKPKPIVTVTAEPVRRPGDYAAPFTLTFSARTGWPDDPTLGKVSIKGPNDFSATATRLSGGIISMDPLGRLAQGQYEWAAPGGAWDPLDNGRYAIFIDPAVVKDREGQSPVNPVGHLQVQLLPTPTPPPLLLKAEVVIAMADGQWTADVSFDNTGGWWQAGWGEVKPCGPILAAMATLTLPPPNSKVAIPASFAHTYRLGTLNPGHYAFFFRSSAGHIGHAILYVPGVEPPSPLEAWKFNVFGAADWMTAASDDTADDDQDGYCTLAEFALGGHPRRPDAPQYRGAIVKGPVGADHFAIIFHRALGSEASVDCEVEVSPDMQHWQPAGDLVELTSGVPAADGTQPILARQTASLASSRHPYMRLRFRRTED